MPPNYTKQDLARRTRNGLYLFYILGLCLLIALFIVLPRGGWFILLSAFIILCLLFLALYIMLIKLTLWLLQLTGTEVLAPEEYNAERQSNATSSGSPEADRVHLRLGITPKKKARNGRDR